MSQVSIFELPTECLFEIFKYIKENCEREKPNAPDEITYKDFISLAICCDTFDDLIQEWKIDLYDRLWENVRLPRYINHIDFEDVNAMLKRKSAKEKETYWRELSDIIRDDPETTISLRYAPKSFHSDHLKAFQTVLCELQNKLWFLEYMNNETGGKGTLQPMLEALAANQSKVLLKLCIYNVPLDHNETQAMAQIDTLTQVECGFDDPQSIGLLSQLPKLQYLKILSKHNFGAIWEPVRRILVESKTYTNIELVNLTITYSGGGDLTLYFSDENVDALDCSPLFTMPGFSSLGISKSPQGGSRKSILNGFRNAPTMPSLWLGNITAEEFAAVSEIASLKRLTCGFAKTQNAELLALLPVLEELTITYVPSSPGSLQGLLAALASRESQTLQKLCLEQNIDAVDAKELTRLKSLRTLECQFADPLDILLLSQLPELEKLNLNAIDRLDQISPLVLIVIKSCKKLAEIHIECNTIHSGHVDMKSSEMLVEMLEAFQDKLNIRINDSNIFGNREKNKLIVQMDFFRRNKLAIESLARVQSLNHMELEYHEVGELRDLFAALAMKNNSNLQSLKVLSSLDFSETTELAKITSLTKFKGHISDIRSLQHLLHLSNFEVLNEFRGQIRRSITFDKFTGQLTIGNNADTELPDNIGLNPLASLQNLRQVFISGVYKEGSMRDFLGQLATCQGKTLQTLQIFPNGELNYAELREVIRMKSLRSLACGLSQLRILEIEQLGLLPQLESLIVVSRRTGSLGSLLRTLAAKKCPTLTNLTVMGESLTPQEVIDVTAISSLERLDCGFCSTEGLDVLSQRSCIEELVMKTRNGEAPLVDLLTAYAASGESKIQKLTIDGPAVGQELATVLSLVLRIPRLKSLKLPIKDTQGIERLAEFLHLEELILSSDPERGSLAVLFRALSLKDSTKLKNLVIENTYIGPEEARHLMQVDSNTSLKFDFKDEEIFPLLANMTNLENLEITTDHELFINNNHAGHLLDILRGCRKLKTINLGITPRCISRDFLKKSLDVLKSVRDPATQPPLELRNYDECHDEIFQMTTADETYLNVIKRH